MNIFVNFISSHAYCHPVTYKLHGWFSLSVLSHWRSYRLLVYAEFFYVGNETRCWLPKELVYKDAALLHHFLQMAIAQRIGRVPTDALLPPTEN